jgi:ferredoxin-NADP reductase
VSATFHALRIAAIDELTDDAVALTFDVPPSLAADFAYTPGQHLNIRGGDDVRRSYSICTAPSSGLLRIGVKRLPGGAFSEGVLASLSVGDTLDVRDPRVGAQQVHQVLERGRLVVDREHAQRPFESASALGPLAEGTGQTCGHVGSSPML